jgi:hypothetical protein
METDIKQSLMNLSEGYPARFREIKSNLLSLEFTIAERKAFLSRQKLLYKCSLRIHDESKNIKFFEMLKESGAGISVGTGDDDFGPGFGFKAEKTKIGPGGREGTIKEQSDLFGKKYQYNFSYEKIRNEIEEIAGRFGYTMTIVLTEMGL